MHLYEIAGALAKLEDLAAEDEQLIPFLDGVQLTLNEKVGNIVKFRQNLTVQADAIDNEIQRLTKLRNSLQGKSERLKDYLSYCLQRNGIQRLDTDISKLSFRKSETLEITDQALIPERFVKLVTTAKIEKNEIKKAIKEGQAVPGAVIVEHQNLQIK